MTHYTVIDTPNDFPRIKWCEWLVLAGIVAGAIWFMFVVGS